MELRVGQRYSSVVDDTSIMVTRATPGDVDLECGGLAMVEGVHDGPKVADETDPARREGTLLGKRYADEAESLEVMCVKPGDSTITLGGVPLGVKAAKQLPSSD